MIKEIRLKNWKSFKDSTLFIDPLTIMIGTNASGKSNLLDALLFLQKVTLGKQVSAAIAGDTESQGIRGGIDWAISKGETASEISVVIQSDIDQKIDYIYSITIEKVDIKKVVIKSESLLEVEKTIPSGKASEKILFSTLNDYLQKTTTITSFGDATQGEAIDFLLHRTRSTLSYSKAFPHVKKNVSHGIDTVLDALSNISILDPIPSLMRDYSPFSDQLLPDASNISGVLAALKPSRKKEVESILTAYLQSLPEKDVSKIWSEPIGKFQSDAMLYCEEKWHDDTLIVDARGMSDGTLRFLAIMTAVLTIKENSLLVIEEIDNGFHPSRANLLVQFLKEVGAKRKVDIICTTHNPAFLDALGNEMIDFISVVYRDEQEGDSRIKLLEDIDDMPKLIGRGSLGRLTTKGLIEESVKK